MVSAFQYCFWIEGSFTFLVFVWGVYYFWGHPYEPVWGGLADRWYFIPWLICELAAIVPFGLITAEFWDGAELYVLLTYSAFLIGEAVWMILTVYKRVYWNRVCLYTVTAAAALLAVDVYMKNPSAAAVVPAILLALHVGLWDAYFWMNTWEAEVERQKVNTESEDRF